MVTGDDAGRKARAAREGRNRKEEGMDRAAAGRREHALAAAVDILGALLASPTRTTSADAVGDDLFALRPDGGLWLGGVFRGLARSGLIRRHGYEPSARPARHAAPLTVWQSAVDDATLAAAREARASELAALRRAGLDTPSTNPTPATQGDLFAGLTTSGEGV